MRKPALVLTLIIICSGALAAEGKNVLGAQVGFLFPPFGFDDPYSGSLGAGLFYERHQLFPRLPLFAGVSAELYGYYPLSEAFSSSTMVCGRLSMGYDFTISLDRKSEFVFSPYLGYGQYWRSFTVYGEAWQAFRPLVFIGIAATVVSESILIGVEIGMVFLIENDLLVTLDQYERVGWRF